MNELSDENEQLKQQIEDCKDVNVRCCNDYSAMRRDVWKYKKENEQLKQELIESKKWEEYVGDIKRENLDKVFKMSIYEIAEAFAYYEKRIKELEE